MRYKRGCAPQPKFHDPKLTEYAIGLEKLGQIMPQTAYNRMMSGLVRSDLTLREKVAFVNMMELAYDD